MTIQVDREKLLQFLKTCEDAEEVAPGEWAVDLYDGDAPMSLDLCVDAKGISVLAALQLLYDEEMDGWYMGERIEDAAPMEAALSQALADMKG